MSDDHALGHYVESVLRGASIRRLESGYPFSTAGTFAGPESEEIDVESGVHLYNRVIWRRVFH